MPKPEGPELFFGLVSAIGTDLDLITEVLGEVLSEYKYSISTVRLSSLLQTLGLTENFAEHEIEKRYNSLMDAGNLLRANAKRGDALAILAVQYIRERIRRVHTGNESEPASRHAYILQSLKHPEEVRSLREIYRSGFFLIGAYSSPEERKQHLTQRIAKSRYSRILPEHRRGAEELIARDEKEEANTKYGQNVQDTFPLSDVFVDARLPREDLKRSLRRTIAILFGYPYHTPTKAEYGMFHAYAAALRSSALGRQVGASIVSPEGEIIALGTNDVPKPGGGLYWEGEHPDNRDFQLGYDSSDEMKLRNLAEVLQRLSDAKWLNPSEAELDVDTRVSKAAPLMKGTRVMSPIEFGRAVHAEMSAFMDALRRGISVKDCTLYTTTFPCHNCAMHIIAAGINRVVFIEPYPKSLATELFEYAMDLSSSSDCSRKVSFEPFVGISPLRYLGSFLAPDRKGPTGHVLKWDKETAWPKTAPAHLSYLEEEESKTFGITDAVRQLQLPL